MEARTIRQYLKGATALNNRCGIDKDSLREIRRSVSVK